MNLDRKNIGNRIKKERNNIGLTQEELSIKLGLNNKSSVSQYEKGDAVPSDDIKLKMCKIFNCSLDYLLCKSNIKNYNDDEKEFRFAYHKEMEGLTEQEIKEALEFYKMVKNKSKENK